ncbi:MAG TPA: Uma2 family endonuclease, partial [Gemmatirosa sp.]
AIIDADLESDVPPDGTRMTLEEFLALPDAPRAELEDGVFEVVPPAGGPHGAVNALLLFRLIGYVRERRLGMVYDSSTAFVLRTQPPLVRSPDVSFVRRDRIDPSVRPGSVPLAPDLAVETLSPSERAGKIQRKVEEYLEHGTELVWLIDPQHRTATVYTRGGGVRWLHEGDALDGGDVLPGFSVPLAFLFEDLAPPV